MGKKRVAGKNTADKVRQRMAAGDPIGALALARKHFAESGPGLDPEAVLLLRTTITAVADLYLAGGRVMALAGLLKEIDNGMFLDPDWLKQLAGWHAKAGNVTRAVELADQAGDAALRAKVAGFAADAAISAKTPGALPADLQSGYAAVVEAFKKYHAGQDDAARERLNDIGLSSPFLEWKVLLRGFLAYSASDDDGARANWARLSSDRLPAKLAAPYRARIDPDAPKTGAPLPADPNSLAGRLKAVQANIGRGRNLSAAFKALETALSFVKTKLPAAVPRLANVMYHAIRRVGQPDDMARFRKLFGSPADDPEFHKLQGQVWEESGDLREALRNWAVYDGWLSGPPPTWPDPLARRARALIQHRMAGIARDIADDEEDSPFGDIFSFFSAPKRGKAAKTKATPPDPTAYLRRAVELAPDWEAPAVELYEAYREAEKPAEAEAAARAFLARVPGSVPMLTRLAEGLARQGRAADALDLRRKALAANPLDRANRVFFAMAAVAAARRLAIDGKLADAEALLAAEAEVCDAETPANTAALRSALARKAGRKDEADKQAETAVAVPGARLAARLYLHANAVLLKCKPADKTAASKALTAALAETPTPLEANLLYAAWDVYFLEGLTYTGQKTQEKKIHDAVLASVGSGGAADGPEFDFENLCRVLEMRQVWKVLAKLAEALAKRFKANPLFVLMRVEAENGKAGGQARPYKLSKWLSDAKRLATASPHERHKQLLPRIDDLLRASNPFALPFDDPFE